MAWPAGDAFSMHALHAASWMHGLLLQQQADVQGLRGWVQDLLGYRLDDAVRRARSAGASSAAGGVGV